VNEFISFNRDAPKDRLEDRLGGRRCSWRLLSCGEGRTRRQAIRARRDKPTQYPAGEFPLYIISSSVKLPLFILLSVVVIVVTQDRRLKITEGQQEALDLNDEELKEVREMLKESKVDLKNAQLHGKRVRVGAGALGALAVAVLVLRS
jgi:hypothetical protein